MMTATIIRYETEQDYPADSQGNLNYKTLVPAFEGRYYLYKEKIIDFKLKGKKRMDGPPVEALLKESKKNIKLISDHIRHNKR
jgi:hypothetical protein